MSAIQPRFTDVWKHRATTYEVTGISPQSNTLAQLLNGFAPSGTLYPPLKRTLREPLRKRNSKLIIFPRGHTID